MPAVLRGAFPHEKFHSCEFSLFMWSQPYRTIIAFSFLRERIKKEKALATHCVAHRFIERETNYLFLFFKDIQSSTKIELHITGCSY